MRRALDALQKAAHSMPETVDPLCTQRHRSSPDGVVVAVGVSGSSGSAISAVPATASSSADAAVGSSDHYGAAGWSSTADRPADTMSSAVWGKVSGFLTGVLSSYQQPAAAPPIPVTSASAVANAATPMHAHPAATPASAGNGSGAAGGSGSGSGSGGVGAPMTAPTTSTAAGASTTAPSNGTPSPPVPCSPRTPKLDFEPHGDDGEWATAAASAGVEWLRQATLVLAAAVRVVSAVDRDGVSVLVHCSDGWDRTAQVCALAQLLMDPYYRTIAGFQVRVAGRRWCLHARAWSVVRVTAAVSLHGLTFLLVLL